MNKAMFIGRLTADPEMRHTTTGKSVCSFRIAVKRRFAREGDEQQADFFPVVAWEKTAEFCNNYFKKGQQVGIVGRIQNRTWDDPEGNRRYITEIVAEEVYFADSKSSSGSGNNITGNDNFDTSNVQDSGGFYLAEDDDLPF
ncbi:single-stranded DNA-binding protein [Acetivibrio saccincola]|uniref:Single-stranded DNA-binding protein n=1 Tax=Acetivibrio saccincola TaxID=1677857 RepID=A0A2S8RAD6_9FIRM|nr:single-stranded DNA-binding protein [Acetivibrio saccincola]NLW26461.1 single-stranded DNA-binding protein [Acetivibrio saccincola]PQQ66755.1 single-stranded DNA-binding protein [Acetivibrio saccincola]HOA97828.1 single-stranded DNA-binding protein [Acetivibrio saccincola]HQD29650.1 single-stranded DNA-binding protein [Acetivibrio saccincola]